MEEQIDLKFNDNGKVKLTRPLVILDLETTGTWIEKDKIIEIAMIRLMPDGSRTQYVTYVSPGILIPSEVTKVTGIKNEDVKGAPKFKDISQQVVDFLGEADLGGFNVERFDLPLLERELLEAGIKFEWNKRAIYDAQKIYHLHERRDLEAAYAFYCGKPLKDAHSALADTEATMEVLLSQVKKYGNGNDTIEALQGFDYRKRTEFSDATKKLRWWNGELYMMFGKYNRKSHLRDIAKVDRPYLEWILTQDFSEDVKDIIEQALEGHFPEAPKEI